MIGLALILLVVVSLLPTGAGAFSLPLERSKEKLQAEDCPSTLRQAQILGKKDAGKFSSLHPLGTWGGFYGTGKDRMRKCSAYMKKTYMEAARKTMSNRTKTRKKHFTPKRSLTK